MSQFSKDFEKAFEKEFIEHISFMEGSSQSAICRKTAEWAAKWMAERCAIALQEGFPMNIEDRVEVISSEMWARYIRVIAKDLEEKP